MKKIGTGWTYAVYDYGDGKVLKRKKSFLNRTWKIVSSDPRELFKIRKTIEKLNVEDRNSFSIVHRLKETNFDFSTIANPVILNADEYKQDFCTPVYVYLKDKNKTELVIDQYIDQIKYFWKYGFADMVYNFTINNALDKEGNIVLIDFNEISDDKERIADSIRKQVWRNRFSVNWHLDSKQKEYFIQKMVEEITVETLDLFWRSSLN